MKKIIRPIIKWLETTKLLAIPRNYIVNFIASYYSSNGRLIYIFNSPKHLDTKGIDLVTKIKEETEICLSDQEAYLIYITVKKLEKIKGDIAEVGVYKGGSAKLMREASKKPLHLFDTFSGLPELSAKDNQKQFEKGNYSATFESVQNYLAGYCEVYFYKGLFPKTAMPVKDKKFSFVHLDVDLYKSTFDCLKFFYPRMNRGGIIISHDYPNSDGVKKAFDNFFKNKPEIIIEPYATGQCLIVKV